MIKKLLLICCYFDYHLKTRLIDIKIAFGSSGKIEKVECQICQKVFINQNKNINLKTTILVAIILFLLLLFLF